MADRGASSGMLLLLLSQIASGCVPSFDDLMVVDGGRDAGRGMDAARADAGAASDAGPRDAEPRDAGLRFDGGLDADLDAGADDAGAIDAGAIDAGHDACVPSCVIGAACGASDGCGGRCLGDCPVPEDELCYGGLCHDSWCAPAACDAYSGTGCTVSNTCYATLADAPNYEDTYCAPPGTALEGDACTVNENCRRGLGCRLGKCRSYCCHAGDLFVSSTDHCPHYCERIGTRLGYCVMTCSTANHASCAADQICIHSAERAGMMYCIETVEPTAMPGDACTYANGCAHGQLCIGLVCRTTCNPASPVCAGGTSCTSISTTPTISACMPD